MSIVSSNEKIGSNVEGVPVGVYYYYVDYNKANNATYLGYVPTIESVSYNPYLNESDISRLVECNFNTDRYGYPTGGIPKCYRIESFDKVEKLLGEIDLFKKSTINSNDEPKMECYPFKYYLVTDYINPPLLVKPQLVQTQDNKLRVYVRTSTLTQQSKYNIFVDNYKYDSNGNLEGIINNTSLMLPVSSTAYAQYLATSSSSFNASVNNALLENDVTLKQGLASNNLSRTQSNANNLLSGLGNLLTLNLGGLASNVSNGIFNNLQYDLSNSQLKENNSLKEYEISANVNAKYTDMLNTPNAIKTLGNDTLFNMINSENRVDVIEYKPTLKTQTRLKQFFRRYGYKLNEYRPIEFTSREHFNYVKTSICNITSEKVPLKHLEEIKDIFNSGVTVWHVENGNEIGNYNVINKEVYS